ncbi:MAG: multiprotein-bridging factor 1 family protein [Planctomycetaceae bacterium]
MPQNITLDGKQYVIVPRDEYERLSRVARLPELPPQNSDGTYPAVAYARASLARKIILRREAVGCTQADLARRAGIRVETLCRIESGKVTPTLASVEKLDKALAKLEKAASVAGC